MALAINLPAAPVQAPIEVSLLGLGNVAAVFGRVLVQAVLLAGKLRVIVCRLLGIDLAVRNATIDAIFLIVDTLLNFIDARMAGICDASISFCAALTSII